MSPRLDPRDLDRRVVPTAARVLRRLVDDAARRRASAAALLRRAGSGLAGLSRRADDRATAIGPLALLRDVPQLALLVVAAVFLSGTAAAVLLSDADAPPEPPRRPSPTDVVRLGVPPGGDVEQYLAQTAVVLGDVAEQLPAARLLAVVHLSAYTPVAQVPPLLDGVELRRIYLRASSAGADAEILALPVQTGTATAVLPALCSSTAARKAEDAKNFTALAESIEATSPEEQASRIDFEAEAVRAAAEAQAYAGECATGFAAVVEGTAESLQALSTRPGVRGVEPAQAGVALDALDVQPLTPETTGVVPATGNER